MGVQVNEELLKSLNGAIDAAVKELISIDTLAKGDMSLQDAKLRPESANGSLPGDNRGESTLKPEDAKKAEAKEESQDPDKANKGENPFADKDKDGKDDKDEKKADKKKDDDEDDDDLDDEKAEKMKAKIKKYEDDKAAKASVTSYSMTKSEMEAVTESMQKSIVTSVTEMMAKSFGERLTQLEGMIKTIASAPQPRASVSGLAPLAKSEEEVATAAQTSALNKSQALDQLFELQKNNDKRVDSTVINRVEMGDYSVLAERGINLK